ncbi:hypothetical protein OIU74_022085 [Salix koriyanagi]|uniref:Galectin n=1 Tax=Salix koriyanagi TaxID=2511006 RepID=A0A9Q0WJB9_9ROSI|nr:hypothetical protein OIU74_022085 [Salix koriyanagi]
MNATEHDNSGYKLWFPCGLTQGSSVTIISIPDGLLGNFQIDLTGEAPPGEPDPPIIFHYSVRLHGDKITEDPVIAVGISFCIPVCQFFYCLASFPPRVHCKIVGVYCIILLIAIKLCTEVSETFHI